MINIIGHVYFDARRTMDVSGGGNGIANVPVVLQNIQTTARLTVYTSNAGKYIFHNVPEGEYRIVEAYGEPAVQSPGDFNNAVPGPVPEAALPPISYAPSPPTGAAHLDSVSPSTIYVTAGSSNLDDQDFFNGPAAYIERTTCFEAEACERSVCRSFDISVPVTITPLAIPDTPEIRCSCEIEVSPGHSPCENESDDNNFKFTITQKIYVDIPIKFGAEVCYDETCAVESGECDD